MVVKFSGEPLTRWNGTRNMTLEEDFYFIDKDNKKWNAPKGSCINGATIPRVLWASVGSPYTGCYRRASVIHDVAVGELCNPKVTNKQRKLADKMFHEACLHDGCNEEFAFILYIGVRIGAWTIQLGKLFQVGEPSEIGLRKMSPEDTFISMKFWHLVDIVKSSDNLTNLDDLDNVIDKFLGI